jgi:hypothetical protein
MDIDIDFAVNIIKACCCVLHSSARLRGNHNFNDFKDPYISGFLYRKKYAGLKIRFEIIGLCSLPFFKVALEIFHGNFQECND